MGSSGSTCQFGLPPIPEPRYQFSIDLVQMRIFTLISTCSVKYANETYNVSPAVSSMETLLVGEKYEKESNTKFYLDTVELQMFKNDLPFAMTAGVSVMSEDCTEIGACRKQISPKTQSTSRGELIIGRPIANADAYFMYLAMKTDFFAETKNSKLISKREGYYIVDTRTATYYILYTFRQELKDHFYETKQIDLITSPEPSSKNQQTAQYEAIRINEAAYTELMRLLAEDIYKYIKPMSMSNSKITISPPTTDTDYQNTVRVYLDNLYSRDTKNEEKVMHVTVSFTLNGYEVYPKESAPKHEDTNRLRGLIMAISPLEVSHSTLYSPFETMDWLEKSKDYTKRIRKVPQQSQTVVPEVHTLEIDATNIVTSVLEAQSKIEQKQGETKDLTESGQGERKINK